MPLTHSLSHLLTRSTLRVLSLALTCHCQCMCVYIYLYIYMCVCVYVCVVHCFRRCSSESDCKCQFHSCRWKDEYNGDVDADDGTGDGLFSSLIPLGCLVPCTSIATTGWLVFFLGHCYAVGGGGVSEYGFAYYYSQSERPSQGYSCSFLSSSSSSPLALLPSSLLSFSFSTSYGSSQYTDH